MEAITFTLTTVLLNFWVNQTKLELQEAMALAALSTAGCKFFLG